MERKGLLLADIHIKAQDYQQTYKEYKFLEKYLEDKRYDYCIILGDFFDRKIYSYEDYIQLAYMYMALIIKHSEKIRIVYGTKSHENDQYEIFNFLEDHIMYKLIPDCKKIDFKVIKTVQSEELFPDLNVLYLPEEYVLDKHEYYQEYFSKEKEYDYVFGHGVIQEVMTNATRHIDKKIDNIKVRKKPAVFTTSELKNICKGQVYFGHYHIHTNISDKVFYVGSFCRFCHGEEEPKGFYEIKNNKKYSNKFIENTDAKKYITIKYGYKDEIFSNEEKLLEVINNIPKKKELTKIDELRVIFNIPENYEKSEFLINLLNEKFKFFEDIKIEIVNGYVELKKQANKEQIKEVFEKYDIIFDKNETDENKLSYFIKEKNGKDIPAVTVKKYLTFKALDILQEMNSESDN